MGLNKTPIEKNQGRILLETGNTVLIEEFKKELTEAYPERECFVCSSFEEFSRLMTEVDLFSDNRRILVYQDLSSEVVDDIADILLNNTDNIILLIVRDIVPRNKSYTKIKSLSYYVKLENPDEAYCIKWVRDLFKGYGVSYTDDVPEYIVKTRGTDMAALRSEVRKLCYFKNVDKFLCERVVSVGGEVAFIMVIEDVLRKRNTVVFEHAGRIEEMSYVPFIHMFMTTIEKYLRIASYREQGLSEEDISDMTGASRYQLRSKYFPITTSYGRLRLTRLFDVLNALDMALRSSKYGKRELFQAYLLKALRV